MENENTENVNSQNDTEVTENTNEESVVSTETEESTELDLEAEVRKQTAHLYTRAKKAEERARELEAKLKNTSGESVQGDLTTKDLYALMDAKVPQDDIDEVRDYAKLKGIPIAEALKSTFVKSLLSEKAEQRNVAKASNTGTTRRSSKLSDEDLLESAKRGKAPQTEEDWLRLARLKS